MNEYTQKKQSLRLFFWVLAILLTYDSAEAKANLHQLVTAIKMGDAAQVKKLLDQGYDPNITDSIGEAAILLVTQAPSVNADRRQKQSVHDRKIKSYLNHEKIVRLLVEHGAIINVHNSEGWTPLMQAQAFNKSKLSDFLIKSGAVQFKGYVPHISSKLKNFDLIKAVKAGDGDWVKTLLDKGCDPNITNIDGQAAILLVTQAPVVTDDLGQKQRKHDRTTWRYLNHEKIVRLLVEHGAKVNVRNEEGWTPLLQAQASNEEELSSFLIKSGANKSNQTQIFVKKRPLNMELITAVKVGDADRVKKLLDQGCDPNVTDSTGEVAILLISYAPKVGITYGSPSAGNRNMSAIFHYFNQDIIVPLLVEHGAIVNVHNKDGWSPLLQAKSDLFPKVKYFLIENMAYDFMPKASVHYR